MQEPYKRILEKRRTQITEQIRWSRELATGLDKSGLLSKEDLRYVETEQNSQSRISAALTRIIANDDPTAFGRFRRLLDDLGNKSMADSLDFDRQRIRWDFDKEINASCLPNYIDLVNAQLLDSALIERDDYTRQCLISVAKRRFEDLRNCLRQQQRDRENFRAALWQTISGKTLTPMSSLSYRAKNTVSLSEMEDAESGRDEVLLEKTKALVELLRRRVVEQKRENEGLLETLQNNNIISPDKSLLQPATIDQFENDVDLFADVSTEDVTQILRWDWEMEKKQGFDGRTDEKGFVHISRTLFDHILQILKPFESQGSSPKDYRYVSQIHSIPDDPSVSKLISLLQSMESELELWRNRSHRLSAELKSLEHEQHLTSTALGLPSTQSPAEDRGDRLERILSKIAELTDTLNSPETTGESPNESIDDQTEQNVPDGVKGRRASADEDLERSRTKTDTMVDKVAARNRRLSVPLMRARPPISNSLPVLQERHRNKNAVEYRKSSRDYGSRTTATTTSCDLKTSSGSLTQRSNDLSHFRHGSLDGRPSMVSLITARPFAVVTSPKNRRRKASVLSGQRSIDSV